MISEFQALVLGVVEGFTEFLPISSTAHLMLASRLMGIARSDFAKTFEIAIQSGAILAVLILYWKRFLDIGTIKKVVLAFVPTAIIGLALYGFVKNFLFESLPIVLLALGVGGVLLIVFEYAFKKKIAANVGGGLEDITWKKAVGIGIFQSMAIVPGVSRAAATIIGGMLMGLRRETIVEFSFLLAVPTMLAATSLDLWNNAGAFSSSEMGVLSIGLISSFLMALVSIKFLLKYIRTHTFTSFGVYRIVLAVIFFIFVI